MASIDTFGTAEPRKKGTFGDPGASDGPRARIKKCIQNSLLENPPTVLRGAPGKPCSPTGRKCRAGHFRRREDASRHGIQVNKGVTCLKAWILAVESRGDRTRLACAFRLYAVICSTLLLV